ncbi:sensor histidine kinase [Mucilaginibacter paludis]|uniref:histidine kinase n=1 Tax=Mucilaginibacter paludis DSM 18603 TaxID=714943 RepID=H1XZC5_9SPHI|nr:HAMP domain-containing sensor histidine kinase [Mucilaginibacter paludis]EHQ25613.1 integral membrane sensor signal transduction histidine kinase [Mucilaginibacter paludis DSM 18603]
MKLSSHYSKASFIVTIIVLIAGAVIYYFAISYISRDQLDRDLTEEFDEVQEYVELHHQLPVDSDADFDKEQTVIKKTNQRLAKPYFYDSIYHSPKGNKQEDGRSVTGFIDLSGQHYKVDITVSSENTQYLVQIIAMITLALTIVLLLILFVTNRFVLNGLWKPFYVLLNQLKAFNVAESKQYQPMDNKVDEFCELDKAIHVMTNRVKNDFQHLKAFTENASHEMMTPLAVITSKLDTFIQDETLRKDQYDQITDIYAATNKLSRLNQSLLLLVKIENELINDAELLNLDVLIAEKLRQFQELSLAKEILVTFDLEARSIIASKYLMDILFNNLFSNAIRHNVSQGKLNILLKKDRFVIQNTGFEKELDPGAIFERFQKGNKSEGTGLGLTIVKNICNLYNWQINYSYDGHWHTFEIVF